METPTIPETQVGSASAELASFMAQAKAPAAPSMPVSPEPVAAVPVAAVPAVAPQVPQVPTPVAEPAQSPTAAIPVPDKFKNPDGTINSERIAKSMSEAEKALEYQKFLSFERELRKTQADNQKATQGNPYTAPQPTQVQPPQTPANLSPFEFQVAQDIFNAATQAGAPMPEGQAIALARVQVKLFEAAAKQSEHASSQRVSALEQALENDKRHRELAGLADHDEWIISPEGQKKLGDILKSKPYLLNAPEPWKEAYGSYLADKEMSERLAGKVKTPTPTAQTVSAPATPVSAASRVQATPTLRTKDEINKYVDTLSPEDQKKFYASKGLNLK